MKQKDVINELKERTGFYKYNIEELFLALEDIIVENMNMATYDEPSEIILFTGWRLGAKRMPERPYCDPRDLSEIITPEKLIPYCRVKQSFRQKINRWEPKEDDKEEETVNDE